MSKKIVKPVSPLIYQIAATFAGVYYEAGRNTGLSSKHKTPEAFAKANLEKFIPYAIKHLLEMLKPTSNCTDFMRFEIYEALTDPINDPNLINGKGDGKTLPDINAEKLAQILKQYDKNKINVPVATGANPTGKPNLKGSTSLSNPFTPKAN